MSTQVISKILNEIVNQVSNLTNTIIVYGKEWGSCPSELSKEESSSKTDYISVEVPELNVEYGAHALRARNFTKKYSVMPVEYRDENGKLEQLVFNSNENTPEYWGKSMTLSYESEDEDEYEQGDADDYWREQAYYNC